MRKNKWIWIAASVVIAVITWNFPLTYNVGSDGKIFKKKIPFYAKAGGYFYRDWMYKDIVDGIVDKKMNDAEKALAIFNWVGKNVMHGVPAGLKVVDDHPLNIIIRQYGASDQLDDIFTILCSYAGMEGGRAMCYNKDKTNAIFFSFIRVKGKWLIFSAAKNKYFLNKKDGIGSVQDYLNGDMVLSKKEEMFYKEFLDNLKGIDFSSFTRADEQMPVRRLPAQLIKFIKAKKNNEDK